MNKTNEKIIVLLATYNGERYLREQINSILSQTYQDFEIYISDDGSSDKTLQIIQDCCKKDKRIKLLPIHEPTGNACSNFLYLLENIDGDLFLFCDQDDVWMSNHIEKLLESYNTLNKDEKQKPVLIHSDLEIVDENLNIINSSAIHAKKRSCIGILMILL